MKQDYEQFKDEALKWARLYGSYSITEEEIDYRNEFKMKVSTYSSYAKYKWIRFSYDGYCSADLIISLGEAKDPYGYETSDLIWKISRKNMPTMDCNVIGNDVCIIIGTVHYNEMTPRAFFNEMSNTLSRLRDDIDKLASLCK